MHPLRTSVREGSTRDRSKAHQRGRRAREGILHRSDTAACHSNNPLILYPTTAALPNHLTGMNANLMSDYVEAVADDLLHRLGYHPIYKKGNPVRSLTLHTPPVGLAKICPPPSSLSSQTRHLTVGRTSSSEEFRNTARRPTSHLTRPKAATTGTVYYANLICERNPLFLGGRTTH